MNKKSKIKIIKKKNNPSSAGNYDNWITFYLNYLNPYFLNNNHQFFQKKWKNFWKVFQLWKEKKLDNEKIKLLIKDLIENKETFISLMKKYNKNLRINKNLVKKKLENLWNDESLRIPELDQKKIQNHLIGKIKKSFPNYSVKEVIIIIKEFLKKSQAKNLPKF